MTDTCPVCSDAIDVFAVGQCDHPVCFKCSTRMRVLCSQLYCAICRTDLPKVLFVENLKPFALISTSKFLLQRKQNVLLESRQIQERFFSLLEHKCSLCPELKPFRQFSGLQNHMRRDHTLHYCDLCLEHVKGVFSTERKTYDRKKLAEHRRVGDEDDRSHRGHPLCKFCDVRYFDNDELVLHLRKQHYFCHFCEADGVTNEFFEEYSYLKEHFAQDHFLCTEGDCEHTQFTNAFRTEIDLRAHKAKEHSKNMKKAAAKQARTLDIDFSYRGGPSSGASERGGRGGRSRGRGHRDRGVVTGDDYEDVNDNLQSQRKRRQEQREELQAAQALSASLTEVQSKGHVNIVDSALVRPESAPAKKEADRKFERRSEDFPTLDGRVGSIDSSASGSSGSMAKQLSLANRFSVQEGSLGDQEFPTLGGNKKKPASNQRKHQSAWSSASSTPAPRPQPTAALSPKPAPKPAPVETTWRAVSSAMPAPPKSAPAPTKPVLKKPQGRMNTSSLNDFPSLSSIGSNLTKLTSSAETSPASKPKLNHVKLTATKTEDKPVPVTVTEEFTFPKKTAKAEPKPKTKKKKKEPKLEEKEDKKEDKTEKEDDYPALPSQTKRKPVSNGSLKNKENVRDEDFPALSQPKKPPGFDATVPLALNNHSKPKTSNDEAPAEVQNFRLSDISSMLTSAPAPPGFSSKPKEPPPGFKKPPPGFPKDAQVFSYSQPNNFQTRNQKLIEDIRAMTGDAEFTDFKNSSSEFRRNKITAKEYFAQCGRTFGAENFQKIIRELLVLLPDISKQQELLSVYNHDQKSRKKKWGAAGIVFRPCAQCQQVLSPSDYDQHLSIHNIDDDFPALG